MILLVVMPFKTSPSRVNILGKVNPRILSVYFTLVVAEERWHVESKQGCGGKRTTSYISSCLSSCFQSKWLILYCICLASWLLSAQPFPYLSVLVVILYLVLLGFCDHIYVPTPHPQEFTTVQHSQPSKYIL